MNKLNYYKTGLDVYYEKLSNGLEIYVVPMPKYKNVLTTFNTKYGSIHNKFIVDGKEITVPHGIAHFLEHKMFETKNNVDPLTFFGKSGTDANANTSNYRTVYLFEGKDNFKENLNYLLNFVQEISITDESVQKEKGIITEEAKMYLDKPEIRLFEQSIYNTFVNDPIKIPIIGTLETIQEITKEDLYNCYNTFYHPSNMFVVVTGPVVPEEVLSIIKENQNTKSYSGNHLIENIKEEEPDYVSIEYEEINMRVEVPKAIINYKINLKKYNVDIISLINYFNLYFKIKFGRTSLFANELINKKSIIDFFAIDYIKGNDHLVMSIAFESFTPNDVIEKIKEEMLNTNISEADFNRKKKAILATYVVSNENIEIPNYHIIESLSVFNDSNLDELKLIEDMKFELMKNIILKENFENYNVLVIKPLS